jgi:type VI secretion system protein ImpH
MTAGGGAVAGVRGPGSAEDCPVSVRLYDEPFAFDFFQAVRLLERLEPGRKQIGGDGPPGREPVRFRAHQSLAFPPSSIYSLETPPGRTVPEMTVAFMGLTGPSGVLPRHYTELLMRLERERKDSEKYATRSWFDLFNHRFISLFFRAWTKYRFPVAYERGGGRGREDAFTVALFSLIGLAEPSLRNRLVVRAGKRTLARVENLGLLYYAGFLAHRPRNAASLEAFLADYFGLPVRVEQFRGQWLRLDPSNRSHLGGGRTNNQLGVDLVAGDRVYDCQSKFRVRLGPLSYARFLEFLPDRTQLETRKAFFLLCHLARLYAGPEFDFEVQPVLRAADVPECQLGEADGVGARLGWNTWVRSGPHPRDAEDAVFGGEEVTQL